MRKSSEKDEEEIRESISIDENVDKIYKKTGGRHAVVDGARSITIDKYNLPDTGERCRCGQLAKQYLHFRFSVKHSISAQKPLVFVKKSITKN